MHTSIFSTQLYYHILVVVCLSAQYTFAEAKPLELEQAIDRAESSNPGLQALRERLTATNEFVSSAGTLPEPIFQYTYFGESVQTRTGPQEAIFSIAQSVPWLSKLEVRKALASSQANELLLLYRQARLNLKHGVTRNFVEIDYLAKAIESTEAHIRLIDQMRAITEERVRGGASLNTLLRLEIEHERTDDQLQKLKRQQYAERCQLAALLSLNVETLGEVRISGTEPPSFTDLGALSAQLISENPELLALKEHVLGADREVKLARLNRYPDFNFGLNYIQVDEARVPTSDSGNDPWNIFIAVSLPIWERKNSSEIRAALAQRRSVEHSLRDREQELVAQLQFEVITYEDNRVRIERYRTRLIPLAEQALENSRAAYQNNQLSILEWIDSQRALLDLNLSLWRAIADLWQSAAKIESLVGKSAKPLI